MRTVLLSLVVVAALAGCGSTRVVRTRVVERPCATDATMTRCFTDLETATLKAQGDLANVRASCKHVKDKAWQCLISIDRSALNHDADCYLVNIVSVGVGIPLVLKGEPSYCPWAA